MNIACLLKSGGDFRPEHVYWLQRQCAEYLPDWQFTCYSDVPLKCDYRLLRADWPLWWGKMEAIRDVEEPTLIMDLDTVLVQKWKPTAEQLRSAYCMRHPTRDGFAHPEEVCGAIHLHTPEVAKAVWERFSSNPEHYIREYRGDDQPFYKRYFDRDYLRFQDHFPDQFVSFKINVVQNGLQEDNTFIVFHGKPRPWDITFPWIPQAA